MAYMNTYPSNQINLNTRLFTSYQDTSALYIMAWNEKLSIKYSPCIGKNMEGMRQYAKEQNQNIMMGLNHSSAIVLIKGIEDILIPAIKEGKAGNVGYFSGTYPNRKLFILSTDGDTIKATIYLDVTADNKIGDPSKKVEHVFGTNEYFTYDEGSDPTPVKVQSEFINFFDKVKDINLLDGTQYHADTYAKMNIESRRSAQPGYGDTYGNGGGFNNQSSFQQAPTVTTNSADFSAFMPNS